MLCASIALCDTPAPVASELKERQDGGLFGALLGAGAGLLDQGERICSRRRFTGRSPVRAERPAERPPSGELARLAERIPKEPSGEYRERGANEPMGEAQSDTRETPIKPERDRELVEEERPELGRVRSRVCGRRAGRL